LSSSIRVALTFDAEHADRPNPGGTERLLETLAAAATRATFFLQGRWVESLPTVARALVDGHHVIGSHGHYHARMSHLTDEGIADDVQRAEEAIRVASGVDPRPWFRCPFGDGSADPRVLGAIAAAGYRHVGWHVDGEDWAEGATLEGVERRVREGIQDSGDGAVVLLHGWPAVTPTVVERLLASAAEDGVNYVGIDELGVPPVESVPW
jgi:peptidoglycan/xylan/chitin deacetylase (PgdA/CDA1 family)